MEYRVTSRFIDKNTSQLFEVGATYQTDNEARAKELQSAGFIGEAINVDVYIRPQAGNEVRITSAKKEAKKAPKKKKNAGDQDESS